MANVYLETTEAVEERVVQFADRPIPFDIFLELSSCDHELELVNGVMVTKMAVQLTHEKLYAWLFRILGIFITRRNLGILLGSRTAVEIDRYNGRLPDLLFVQRERQQIVKEKAIYGAPDLVIEIVSPNDRPSDIIELETDYRTIGVPEIIFIDPRKHRIRALRKREADYVEEVLTMGELRLEAVAGFHVQVEWLLQEPRPDELDTLVALLAEPTTTE